MNDERGFPKWGKMWVLDGWGVYCWYHLRGRKKKKRCFIFTYFQTFKKSQLGHPLCRTQRTTVNGRSLWFLESRDPCISPFSVPLWFPKMWFLLLLSILLQAGRTHLCGIWSCLKGPQCRTMPVGLTWTSSSRQQPTSSVSPGSACLFTDLTFGFSVLLCIWATALFYFSG